MSMARIAKKDIISSITREQHFHRWGNGFRYSEHTKCRRASKWLSVCGYQFFSLWHVLDGHVENLMFNAYLLRRGAGCSGFVPGIARHTNRIGCEVLSVLHHGPADESRVGTSTQQHTDGHVGMQSYFHCFQEKMLCLFDRFLE